MKIEVPATHAPRVQRLLSKMEVSNRKLSQAEWDAENAKRELFSFVWRTLKLSPKTDGRIERVGDTLLFTDEQTPSSVEEQPDNGNPES